MEQLIKDINPKTSEIDIAYLILKENGQGLSFRELMQQIGALKGISADNPQLMAAVHTQINLDNRFLFLGQGSWGLKEWTQGKVIRRSLSHASSSARTIPFQRRSLDDEVDTSENEYTNNSNYDNNQTDDDDGWDE